VQSLNDFIVFGTMAVGSFSSGGVLARYGWDVILWISFLPVLVAAGVLAWTAAAREVNARLQSADRTD